MRAIVKRLLDIAVAIVGLFVFAPLLVIVALAVRLKLGCPVLFRQRRSGLHGTPFTIYKFRTMTEARDAQGRLLPDAQRLTGLGRFMRGTSLDELPELFNILKGEMSLVGPRPLLIRYVDRYPPGRMRRHDVRPGITGWAQVNGRNAISWQKKFALDMWYVSNWSLWLDLKIVFLTARQVLRREGINQPGRATADEFMGSPS